ncbi:hypothetical protein [Enterococcus casseliflavus]
MLIFGILAAVKNDKKK